MKNKPKHRSKEILEEIKNSLREENGELFWLQTKNQRVAGNKVGSPTAKGYIRLWLSFDGKNTSLSAHHVVWFLHTGEWPTRQLDHIDRDKKNNRFENLRLSDDVSNAMNRAPHKNTSSTYKGVSWNNKNKNWNARIWHNGKLIHLGTFSDEWEAAEAYNKAVLELKPDTSYLNKKG
jgi:hypothetical protein